MATDIADRAPPDNPGRGRPGGEALLPLPVPTFCMKGLSLFKQSSSSSNLPLVPCKEASHGGRTVRRTLPRDRAGGEPAAAARERAIRRRRDPAGGVLGGAARPAGPLGVQG